MDEVTSPQVGRAKRQKIDRKGRLSALDKLRKLKGSKNKYEVDELDSVYEEVDESEYTKKVLERQDDDWIVDDDGSGYIEDGRDIFDDDLDNESIQQTSKSKESGPRKKKNANKSKGNIRNMLMGMSSKKESQVKLDDDDILNDLMAELKDGKPETEPKKSRQPNKFSVPPQTRTTQIVRKSAPPKSSTTSQSQHINDSSEDEEQLVRVTKNMEKLQNPADLAKSRISPLVSSISQEIDDTSDTDTSSYKKGKTQPPDDGKLESSPIQHIDDVEEDISQNPETLTTSDTKYSSHSILDKKKQLEAVLQSKEISKEVELAVEDIDMLTDTWDDDFGEQMIQTEVPVNKSKLPLHINETGKQVFRFYWWDAFEDPYKQPGIVYLFGKVYVDAAKTYVSCCVAVKNIDRRIYLLPREHVKSKDETSESDPKPVSMMDVYKEFNQYAGKNGIKSFRSCTVTKSYAFEEKGVPKTSEYLEVRYPARDPPVSANFNGPTIEHVFGTSVNALELLLIEKKIKGPCWLDIEVPILTTNPSSWCKIEVDCLNYDNISLPANTHGTSPPPPLVIATLNVRVNFNAKSDQNEIAMIGVLLHHKYHIDKAPPLPPFTQHFCLITKPEDAPWIMCNKESLSKSTHTELIHCEKERNLLEEFLNRLGQYDPDLLVGYDCGFQFDVLMHRMFDLKIPNWSRIGRLKRNLPPVYRGRVILGQALSGRLVCDIQTSAKELNLKVKSYDLESLCTNVLKKKETKSKEVKPEDTAKYYTSLEKLVELVRLTMVDASYIIMIMYELNVMPLALQITCIAGNILSRTLSAGRAERNEYLLLHAFHDRSYITPDKRNRAEKNASQKDQNNPRKKKAAYAGGLVLDPKKGFYDTLILLMDFNSLYPSIIQEYNICFTTIPGAAYSDSEELCIPETDLDPGVIPTEIRKLVESRGQVKNLMKAANISPELKIQYNIRQLALKLTANSMYGCLGATHCRFYAKGLAALVTAKGREILTNTKDLVERMNYQVIYGDTDSIMINTNVLDYEQVFAIGKKIQHEINKLYKKVELDVDGVFRYLLLLQKKKYAAVTINKLPDGQLEMIQEYKGLDIVRRDWCQLACEVGRHVLDQLLCEQQFDVRLENIFEILRVVSKKLKDGNAPLSALVITKQLSKNPSDYPDKKQAHVTVALRLNEKGGRMWKAGDTVPYIICEDGTDKSATERAYHVDELKNSEKLKVDINYYLLSQVFPVIMRICEPIEGIDDVLLAEHLGLRDIYKPKQQYNNNNEVLQVLDEEKFKYCEPLKFVCQNQMCQTEITIDGAFTKTAAGVLPVLSKCTNEECNVAPWRYLQTIQNRLQLAIRAAISKYYEGWMECEDPACFNKTRRVPQQFFGVHPVCDLCQKCIMYRIYTETQLYNQLSFYHNIFDINQPQYKNLILKLPADVRHAYNILREFVEKHLRSSAYSIVDLTQLFSYLDSTWTKVKVLHDQNSLSEICDENHYFEKIDYTTFDFNTNVISAFQYANLL